MRRPEGATVAHGSHVAPFNPVTHTHWLPVSRAPKLRARFRATLRERLSLRWHMFLIMMGVFLVASVASWALRGAGVSSMALRYPLVTLLAYGAFLGLVRLWLYYVTDAPVVRSVLPEGALSGAALVSAMPPRTRHSSDAGDLIEGAADVADVTFGDEDVPSTDSSGGGGSSSFDVDEGALILIVVAVVLAVLFGLGVYVVWEAPVILSDALFQLLLGAAVQQSARGLDTTHWLASVWRATRWSFLVALTTATIGGVTVSAMCPGATKMGEVLNQCVWPE